MTALSKLPAIDVCVQLVPLSHAAMEPVHLSENEQALPAIQNLIVQEVYHD